MDLPDTYVAFLGWKKICSGNLAETLRETSACLNVDSGDILLIFHEPTGKQVDFDLRGSVEAIVERAAPKPGRPGPGRPKLGVTSREVSLLPRHWEWLESQPNGVSASIRRLVDQAAKQSSGEMQVRSVIDAVGRVMTAMGGNLPGFEEAYRALYARNREGLKGQIRDWPQDLRDYVLKRVDEALGPGAM